MSNQPTIITNRQPLPNPAIADPVQRILEGIVQPGERIGEFELVEYIGGGGMGRVYHALDTKLARPVALKVLAPELAADADSLQRFQNEAQSAAKLDHENIVRVYAVGEDRGLHYIAFEFVAGENLRQLVERKGPLPLAEALNYTRQIVAAMSHAYDRGIVHRDIKPSNVLINSVGRVKLIDMGLARLQRLEVGGELTASGVTLGTFDYIAPEQARDPRAADARSDIYSLGCTLFFMLTGRPPFPEGTILQKLLQHQNEPPPDVRRFRPDLPPEVSYLLARMMAKEPEQRPATPHHLAQELEAFGSAAPAIPSGFEKIAWRQHLSWAIPVAVLLFIVLLLDRAWLWKPAQVNSVEGTKASEKESLAALPELRPEASAPLTSKQTGEQSSAEEAVPAKIAEVQAPQDISPQSSDPRELAETQPLYDSPWPEPLFEWWAPPFGSLEAARQSTGQAGERPQEVAGGQQRAGSKSSASGETAAEHPQLAESGPGAKSVGESTPAVPPKMVPLAAGARNVLVVDDVNEGENHFSSLVAACAVARDGDTIELRFNGPREERPLRLANVEVTIRAGSGYQPVLLFRPTELDPVKYPRSMITLAAGRLTLSNVAIELHVPRDLPSESWTLIEISGGQTLRLERSTLTICNASDQLTAYHPEVAFFRVRPAADAPPVVGPATAAPLTAIELLDCIVRGEAGLLRVEQLPPVHLLWNNGLLVTCEPLLAVEGKESPPRPDEILRWELRYVTALALGGLCRLTTSPSKPYPPAVQVVLTDSIVWGSPGIPLIEQLGVPGVEKARQQISWSSDRVCYQDVDVFWMVRDADPQTPIEVMTFEAWKSYWGPSRENQTRCGRLPWKTQPAGDRPLHAQTPADYTLDNNMFGETAEKPPGCDHYRLPIVP